MFCNYSIQHFTHEESHKLFIIDKTCKFLIHSYLQLRKKYKTTIIKYRVSMLLAELNLTRQKTDLLSFNLQSLLNIENYKETLMQIAFCNLMKGNLSG